MKKKVVEHIVIPACEGRAFIVIRGQFLRVIDVEGKQVGDMVIYNAHDYREYFDSSQTVFLNCLQGIGNAKRMTKLYSKPPHENVMFTVTDDKVGVHFPLLGGKCSRLIYILRDKAPMHRSCQDNLAEALKPYGLTADDIHDAFNIFMNVEIDEKGCFVIKPPLADKGDYIEMRAEMDCLAAISACPSDTAPTNDFKPKPLGVEILEER